MSSRRMLFKLVPAVALTAACAAAALHASEARADSGRFNLHIEPSVFAPPGFGGAVGLDWQFRPPFALEWRLGGAFFPDGESRIDPGGGIVRSAVGAFTATMGVRFRLGESWAGYANEPGGDLAGNFWFAPHLGFAYVGDGAGALAELGLGYEWSVVRPLSIGIFARGGVGIGNNIVPLVSAGVSFSLEFVRIEDPDTDHDGLTDRREGGYGTDPTNPDTDGDGLGDGLEVRTRTNPTRPDTDNDGLPDGVEDHDHDGAVGAGETDPRTPDTDTGGSGDGWEATHNRNPLDPADDDDDHDHVVDEHDECLGTPAGTEVDARGCAVLRAELVLEGIHFAFDSAAIEADSEESLTRAASILRENPTVRVEIGGHTDDQGDRNHNMTLSAARAQSVFAWLVAHGIDAARMDVHGYGPTHPRVPNINEVNRAINRRIEFRRVDGAGGAAPSGGAPNTR